ncbi:uncharacterized protein RCO7_00997 [Rhynchosporium graminicola]|uniref:Uncharacterized protein n=1 Tax=Rhynchosporium graminicola TaxID=2792576 RepID=A0A1E1JQH3_9HELO|nr:uncharacterized protein RCO7_00997 [Rhynchosporium commune]
MGIFISCLNVAKSSSSSKPTTKSATGASRSQPQAQATIPGPEYSQEQPPQFDPTPAPVREGLVIEHLATSPPPILEPSATAPARAEGVDKNAKEVPFPALGTATPTSTQAGAGKATNAEPEKMATDEEYMSFLDKANQDPNEGVVKTKGSGKLEFKALDEGVKVPDVIQKMLGKGEAFYVSDADEPFVSVALKSSGKGLPDEVTFAKLIDHPSPKEADVQIMDVGEWDTQGQYKDVVEATREAVKGSDVRVYRITKDGSRVEYWVVGVDGGHLVGVKALAVES